MKDNLFLIAVTLAALAVRLIWNLRIHPPDDYVYSDMAGYAGRAARMLKAPLARSVDEAFFPFGAHYLLAAVKAAFGEDNRAATAIYQALAGTSVVSMMYALSRRLSGGRWVPRIVGAVGAFYYPLYSLGGYYLSETPYSVFLTASALLALRLADEGRRGDAWLLGVVLGLGAWVRPQILMSALFLGLFWLLRRRALPRLRPGLLFRAAIPLCLLLALSAARAKYHSGRYSLVAQNGGVNRVFGRCHNVKTEAVRAWFGPPPFGQLLAHEKAHPDAWVKLDPALGLELKIRGYMWEERKMDELARKCVEETGWLKQAHYGLNHVILLWGYNTTWPDSGQRRWQAPMRTWNVAHTIAFLPGLSAALGLCFRRRRARHALLAMNVFALMAVAVLYFGDTRFRTPYDPVIIALAVDVYGLSAMGLLRLMARIRT
ncbi:MAG: glycosyltransferase family 39 protein [Polyangiaceae bacterium]|nr:glycosyltransferase family 39 protein [Polyangiaceae bacterium]